MTFHLARGDGCIKSCVVDTALLTHLVSAFTVSPSSGATGTPQFFMSFLYCKVISAFVALILMKWTVIPFLHLIKLLLLALCKCSTGWVNLPKRVFELHLKCFVCHTHTSVGSIFISSKGFHSLDHPLWIPLKDDTSVVGRSRKAEEVQSVSLFVFMFVLGQCFAFGVRQCCYWLVQASVGQWCRHVSRRSRRAEEVSQSVCSCSRSSVNAVVVVVQAFTMMLVGH